MMHWRSFTAGAILVLLLMTGSYLFSLGPKETSSHSVTEQVEAAIPFDAVTITPLRVIYGKEVPFEGKIELRQALAGKFAQKIIIVNFQASGEHADKSKINIVWENGEVETVYPGTKDRIFPPEKRAKQITVVGYSVRERRIFQDSNRKGNLSWEIHYEPVEM
ncbi:MULTISPECIES: hypothetical protein [Pelosinus]|nr:MULTISPECIES: hypothetical protein [Pelosinus]MCC5466779.1 hypothetical protein [Pelosinus baikalensis]